MSIIYKDRRTKLVSNLSPGLFVLQSAPVCYFNDDCEYLYRQNSNFYYYTGFDEPDATLFIQIFKNNIYKYYLFIKQVDKAQAVWNGQRYSKEDAITIFGADCVYDNTDLEVVLNEFYKLHGQIKDTCYMLPSYPNKPTNIKIVDPTEIMERQRLVKAYDEIEVIRKSCAISANAHIKLMEYTHPNMYEKDLDALFTYCVMKDGCKRMAYNNIIACGNNATTLHYVKNDDRMSSGNLVLVDAGGEWKHYAADITRTYPVNGKFTEAQANVYELVLNTQKACIELVKPGTKFGDLHDLSVKMISEGLLKLGIIHNTNDYKKYYMHSIGHWMGLDVHDCQKCDRFSTILQTGHIFTVEPGVYIPINSNEYMPMDSGNSVPEKYLGIGVRIEDDILVTRDGYEVLTCGAPKEIKDIEMCVGGARLVV